MPPGQPRRGGIVYADLEGDARSCHSLPLDPLSRLA